MESVEAPLKLITRKFLRQLPHKFTSRKPLVSKKWLLPTIGTNKAVLPEYQPVLHSVNSLHNHTAELKKFHKAMKLRNFSSAESVWKGILASTEAQQSFEDPKLYAWTQLSKPGLAASTSAGAGTGTSAGTGHLGPILFTNALNDIVRFKSTAPEIVKNLVRPSGSPLDSFVLGYIVSKVGKTNIDLAIELVNNEEWSATARCLGWTALLESIDMDPALINRVMTDVKFPEKYVLPQYLVTRLAVQNPNPSEWSQYVSAFRLLVSHNMIAPSKPMDKLLRKLYTGSDAGARAVREAAAKVEFPWYFYPFLVRRLCERATAFKDPKAKAELDALFDNQIAALASYKPSLVLHLLVMRIIATDGVQATSPVLNRWAETDPNGVSEPTWLLLFQSFRRIGRPDKCLEVLGRVLQSSPRLSLPFVGEYLMYTAQFHNLHEFIHKLLKVIPEMGPLLKVLGITEYAESLIRPEEEEGLLPESSRYELTIENRDFAVDRIHESWLTIMYQAVLVNVESKELAITLFGKYLYYLTTVSAGSATSLRVADQFVALMCNLPDATLEDAEELYREALQHIKWKRPMDGKNHSKGLELLCYKYMQAHDIDSAVRLLVDASTTYGINVKRTTLDSWVDNLPRPIRQNVIEWAENNASVVYHA